MTIWKRCAALALILATLAVPACDEGAMAVLGIIGGRPDFDLYAQPTGAGLSLNASAGRSFVTENYFKTELYMQTGGEEPYGTFEVVAEGPDFEWIFTPAAPGIYHFRAGIIQKYVDDDTGEITYGLVYRSTPVTVAY
jgi:hypothetical protein